MQKEKKKGSFKVKLIIAIVLILILLGIGFYIGIQFRQWSIMMQYRLGGWAASFVVWLIVILIVALAVYILYLVMKHKSNQKRNNQNKE